MATQARKTAFAVCISSADCDDLVTWKLYRVLPDASAALDKYLRIIDESGEDYLYPAKLFVLIDLPPTARKKFLATATRQKLNR